METLYFAAVQEIGTSKRRRPRRHLLTVIAFMLGVAVARCTHPREHVPQVPPRPAQELPPPLPPVSHPLLKALAAAAIGVALLVIPPQIHQKASASIELSTADALLRAGISGVSSGRLSATTTLDSVRLSTEAAPPSKRQLVAMTLMLTARTACERLARSLGGGCESPPRRPIDGNGTVLGSDSPFRLIAHAPAPAGALFEDATTLRFGGSRVEVEIGCGPDQLASFELTVANRKRSLGRPCAPFPKVKLRLLLAYPAPAHFVAETASEVVLKATAARAWTRTLRPTVVVGERSTTLLDPTTTRVTAELPPHEHVELTVTRQPSAMRPGVQMAIDRASSVEASRHGELLPSLYDTAGDYLLGGAGVLFGVSASLLVTIPIRRRPR